MKPAEEIIYSCCAPFISGVPTMLINSGVYKQILKANSSVCHILNVRDMKQNNKLTLPVRKKN